jgi:predicted lipoprotein with Yx(FWY)xxD motif
MKPSLAKAAAVSAAVLCVGAVGAEATSTTAVNLAKRDVGKILVTSRGFTLYAFTRDTRNHDKCMSIKGCAKIWPLLKKNGRLVAGKGVNAALLGSISLPNDVRQVTYAGHPLYMYSQDSPGATSYVGAAQFGGTWEALTSTGKMVK